MLSFQLEQMIICNNTWCETVEKYAEGACFIKINEKNVAEVVVDPSC